MNEELNKKLAEWARFELVPKELTNNPDIPVWFHKDGWESVQLPNFTQSLDACFKWLVPKLATIPNRWDNTSSDGIWFRLECISGAQEYSVSFYTWNSVKPFYETPSWELDDKPALALCKAIEKLIDGEK